MGYYKKNSLYENLIAEGNTVHFEESKDEYGDISISAYNYKDELLGYMILVIHKSLEDLDSEISDTDSYETAMDVTKKLSYGKPVVELADVDVTKKFRHNGVSKMLLEYVLDKYKGNQFYLRVCPTDGVTEETLANSVEKYGFINITSTDNGTFMVKK